MFTYAAPSIQAVNNSLTWLLEQGTGFVKSFTDWGNDVADSMFRIFNNLPEIGEGVQLTDRTLAYQSEMEKRARAAEEAAAAILAASGRTVSPGDKIKPAAKISEHDQAVQSATAFRAGVGDDSELAFLSQLDNAANEGANGGFSENSFVSDTDERIAKRAEELASINSINTALNDTASIFGSFAAAAEASGSKSFKTFKKLQVAVATAAAISAIIQVWTAPDIPTYYGKLAASIALGAGLAANLASLKSTTISGGGGSSTAIGGGSAGATPAQSTATGGDVQQAQTSAGKDITINIQGNGNYTAEQVEELIDAINENDTGRRISANRVA